MKIPLQNLNLIYLASLISIIFGSLIVYSLTVLDELIIFSITLTYLVLNKRSVIAAQPINTKELKNTKYDFYLIAYLLLNSTISLLVNRNFSTMRYLIIFTTLLILIKYSGHRKINKQEEGKLRIIFWAYAIFVLVYYLVLTNLGLDWTKYQAVLIAGSTYLMLPIAFGGSKSILSSPFKAESRIYYFLMISISIFYDSRSLTIIILLLTCLLLIRLIALKNLYSILKYAISYLLIAMLAVLLTNAHNSFKQTTNNYSISISQVYFSKLKTSYESAQFLNNPRTSDVDRQSQVFCSISVIRNSQNKLNLLFGYGQNTHKLKMKECSEMEKYVNLQPSKPVRPVGVAAFIVDFGIAGILLLLTVILQYVLNLFCRRQFSEIFVYLIPIVWLLFTNVIDSMFFWIAVLPSLNHFLIESFDKSKAEK